MAIRVETRDPGVDGIREAADRYKRKFPEYGDAVDLYCAIMEEQQRALPGIECTIEFSGLDIDKALKEGRPLLDPSQLDIPLQELRRVLTGICSAVEEKSAAGFAGRGDLLAWEGLGLMGFQDTRDRLLKGEGLDTEAIAGSGDEGGLAAGIIWESLVPFYRKCARGLQDKIDHSLWMRGYCPVCGLGPLMGKFQQKEGLWLLECRLCHTLWNVRRAACPFCSEGPEGSLEYLYLQDHSSYRAYYCGHCGRYVKTVDLRSAQRDAVLPLENIVTELMGLDRAAEQEGLKPA
ncbi:MAG: formate dehydrogenase accessory protein FdhE [Actinomycetota bacterium]